MKKRNLLSVLFFVLLFTSFIQVVQSQTSQVIFDEPVYKIHKFWGAEQQNTDQKNLYVQSGHVNTNNPNDSYRIYKYNPNTGTWYQPYNNYFEPVWVFNPNSNSWGVNPVSDLIINSDTTVLLKFLQIFAIDVLWEEIGITLNSGNDSYNIEVFKLGGDFGGFDIDSVHGVKPWVFSASFYVSTSFYSNSKVYHITYDGVTETIQQRAIVPGIKSFIFDGKGLLKVNPFKRDNIFVNADDLMLSTNSGYNFFSVNTPPVKKILFPDTDRVYAYTDATLYKSTNGGSSFNSVALPFIVNVVEIDPDNQGRMYAGTENGLYISYDEGLSWQLYYNTFNNSQNITGISKNKNSGDTLFVSNGFSVYKVWDRSLNFNQTSTEVPSAFRLNQNFPNPFNPSTTISFDIPQASNVKLTVYDALGREVARLVNEHLSAGSYNYQFSVDNYQLTSGVYYYRLEAGEFVETKRMVILK